jgi:hypothetical protein
MISDGKQPLSEYAVENGMSDQIAIKYGQRRVSTSAYTSALLFPSGSTQLAMMGAEPWMP